MSSVFLLLLFVTISIHDRFQLLPTHAYPPPLSLMSANIARPHYIYPLPHSILGTCGELFLLKSKKNTGQHLYLKRYLVLDKNYTPADLTMPDRAIQTQINADTASGTGRPSTSGFTGGQRDNLQLQYRKRYGQAFNYMNTKVLWKS